VWRHCATSADGDATQCAANARFDARDQLTYTAPVSLTFVMFWFAVRRLVLGVSLIVAASAVLLWADLDRRVTQGPREVRRVAILQHASTTLLDDGAQGIIDGLAERGFSDGGTIAIERFNSHGDMATGDAIARQVTSGDYDLVITVSTPSMQAVANNNREGRVPHIFGIVADPFSAGIGLNAADPNDHPKHMTGQSTFLPVKDTFELAQQMLPGLQRVGVAWNPAESNSEAFVKKAREACAELGLTLLEANVDGSAAVTDSINSLISRNAQVLWVGGDNTMMAAIDSAIATARRGGIPVITITPGKPDRGSLIDVGLDFYAVGKMTGGLAADVLDGADIAAIPVTDVKDQAPRRIVANTEALKGLKGGWRIPDEILQRASALVDATGVHERGAPAGPKPLTKRWKVDFIQYASTVETEEAEHGVREGFKEAGLVEGRDYEIRVRNAQGDMATVSGMIDAAISERADLLITFSTPTLQAAIRRTSTVPIVFTLVANAVAAGAGTDDTHHVPNVTGVYLMGAYEELLDVIQEVMPRARRLGTLFVPAEVNTVFHRDRMLEATRKRNFTLATVAANTSSDMPDASLSLASLPLDAIAQLPGNLTSAAFPSLAQAGQRARLPIFAFATSQARGGAMIAVARDYDDGGRESAQMAARVMRGEAIATMPFQEVKTTKITVNLDAARAAGITIPPALIARAHTVLGGK
jgi:ABC-type uncharacterized transport system substrate-binding protein